MSGIRLERHGDVRHCQGTVLADWIARSSDDRPMGTGTNVFTMGTDGRIEHVVGFWSEPPAGKDPAT